MRMAAYLVPSWDENCVVHVGWPARPAGLPKKQGCLLALGPGVAVPGLGMYYLERRYSGKIR
jgi:hypothetical protein